MAKPDGGAAFPFQHMIVGEEFVAGCNDCGMSLRDYFAARAIALFVLDKDDVRAVQAGIAAQHELMAQFCYSLADAMLAEREK